MIRPRKGSRGVNSFSHVGEVSEHHFTAESAEAAEKSLNNRAFL